MNTQIDRMHNNPPESVDTPPLEPAAVQEWLKGQCSEVAARINELLHGDGKKRKGFDGFPDEVSDIETSQRATDFLAQITKAAKDAEASRKLYKGKYDEAGKAVQAYFRNMATPLDEAKATVIRRQTVFLQAERRREQERLDAERRRLEEKARLEREEAEAARRRQQEAEEQAATRAQAVEAQDSDDIPDFDAEPIPQLVGDGFTDRATEDAERIADDAEARAMESAADAAAMARVEARPKVTGALAGSTFLRTKLVVASVDMADIDLEALRLHLNDQDIMKAARRWLQTNKTAVADGRVALRGAQIIEESTAMTRT